MRITNLFPVPLGVDKLENGLDETLAIAEEVTERHINYLATRSNLNVFGLLPGQVQHDLARIVRQYVNEAWNYDSLGLNVTTSWFIKTEEGGRADQHSHMNSMFSCIWYLNDCGPGVAPITFHRNSPAQFYHQPTMWTEANSIEWELTPERGAVILFPSYLQHSVKQHASQIPRWALTFNIFPVGPLGFEDSYVNISPLTSG